MADDQPRGTILERPNVLEPTDLTPCSAREALQRELHDLQVEDEKEVVLSSARRGYQKYFARIQVRAFDDLQHLGLVPRRLKEQSVREAIAADDEEALRLAREMMLRRSVPLAGCDCAFSADRSHSFNGELRSAYRGIRKDYHPALSRVLSEHFRTEFSWDSTLAGSVRGWVRRLIASDLVVKTVIARDITIGRDATLFAEDSAPVFLARSIYIHRTGKLVHKGGFLKIWAHSIESFLDIVDITTKATKFAPWHLEN